MSDMKHTRVRLTVLLSMIILAALFFASPVLADWENTGKNKKIVYTDATGARVTGLQTIGTKVYYFNEGGYLVTGWAYTPEGYRYFREDGKMGNKLGSMVAGRIFKIKDDRYGFGPDGVVLAGFQQIGDHFYYFSESGKLGVRGRAYANKFKSLQDGRRAYFNEKGRMVFGKWVENHKYYIDGTGNVLRNWITSDGYVLNKKGKVKKRLYSSRFVKIGGKWYFYKKKKGTLTNKVFKYKKAYYYVDEFGVRQTGWITWNGYDYYFQSNGKAVTGTKTIDGESYVFDSKGRLEASDESVGTKATTGKASILILCGHGQGDSGAVGCNGKYVESEYTRDFGGRVFEALKKNAAVNVYIFNTSLDMYQQMKSALSGVSGVTGSGSKKMAVKSAIKKNSNIPDPTKYDYVLEIHFNATAVSAKDPDGDGKKKGTGTYVNSYKSAANRKIDAAIINSLNSCGLNTWGSGVYGSSGLLNAKVYQELGVNYSLLETCFIDDKDDMIFYLNNRDAMAAAVAGTIVDYFK